MYALSQRNAHVVTSVLFGVYFRHRFATWEIYECINSSRLQSIPYRKTSNIRRTLGNKIVDHSDVVGASSVGAAPTTSSFST